MGPLSWILIGLLAGWLAERATGRRAGGLLAKIAIGIVGGLLGGALFQLAGQRAVDDFSLWSLLVAFVGATVFLLVLDAIGRGGGPRTRRWR